VINNLTQIKILKVTGYYEGFGGAKKKVSLDLLF